MEKTVTSSSYHFSLQILHSLPTLRDKYNGLFVIQIEKINKAQKKKRKMGQSFFGNGKKKRLGQRQSSRRRKIIMLLEDLKRCRFRR